MAIQSTVPIAGEMHSINPVTGEVMRTFEIDSPAGVESKLQRAHEAFLRWRRTSFAERSRLMLRAAEVLEDGKQVYGRIMTMEMGKPLKAAVQEAEKSARACRYYAENAKRFLADEPGQSDAAHSFVRFQPLGPVLAVMPWNFPFWQVFRFAAPGLMAGNVGLLKHASNVPQCALAIADVFRKAGLPEDVLQALLIPPDRVGDVIADPRVAAVTLTGSVGAGASVASAAGKQIKKTVLELGGSDPFIVMPSANFDRAVATAVQARVINNGQSCIAAKRFIVHEQIYGHFEKAFVERMKALKIGDPMKDETDVGPLATPGILKILEDQVNQTVQMGARVLTGGKRLHLDGKAAAGNYYAPTVLANIPKGSPADNDELFGPVASLFRVGNIEEAIALANDSKFGLGASCWTNDSRERDVFINDIESGLAFINGMVASDPRIPFGGVKQSGYGRELGLHGIREFVNAKTVCIYDVPSVGKQNE
jgi:succinate-semialdehyde dehydrogenase/glutarate-semialdehyde dehydrogenase